jgi:hypothetical protein
MHEAEVEETDTGSDSPAEAYSDRPPFEPVRSQWPLT